MRGDIVIEPAKAAGRPGELTSFRIAYLAPAPETAQRVVNELKDKIGGIALAPAATSAPAGLAAGTAADAVSALVNLGYSRSDAFGAVNEAAKRLGAAAQIDALIRAGLKELAR